ncbi:hypothetical protein [Streptomyces sp. NPDC003032]
MVVAERARDDGSGHFQYLLADRRGAAGGRGDTEVVDQLGQSEGVQRLTGPSAGEQPAGDGAED